MFYPNPARISSVCCVAFFIISSLQKLLRVTASRCGCDTCQEPFFSNASYFSATILYSLIDCEKNGKYLQFFAGNFNCVTNSGLNNKAVYVEIFIISSPLKTKVARILFQNKHRARFVLGDKFILIDLVIKVIKP